MNRIKYINIDEQNFNQLLTEQIQYFDDIKIAPIQELADGELVTFDMTNRSIKQASNRTRKLGPIKANLETLASWAKRQYEKKKSRKLLEAGLNKDKYSAEADRKAFAENESESELIRWESVKSLVNTIHVERQDLYDYQIRLQIISKNLQSEAYASGNL